MTALIYFLAVWLSLLAFGDCANGTATVAPGSATTGTNSECVILGVDAEGFLERIDPRKFLFVDSEQRSYLQRSCDNYKKMRSLTGCVPQQSNSIYDYACDTIYEMARSVENAACWNRTTSCALVKLLPPTDSISAAYCKFLTATGLQLGCALELAPPCESPSNAAISQAATKSRSFLDTFQCAVLAPPPTFLGVGPNVTGLPIVEPISPPQNTPAPSFNMFPNQAPALPATLFPKNQRSTEAPFVMKSKLPNCDLGQNARGLMCAANLLGVQDKFSDTSGSLIFQELAKDNSSELEEICQKFNTYRDCMFKNVFTSNTRNCAEKSHVHDFSLLFYSFCDPANQPRIKRIRPCVQKLLKISDPAQATQFQKCRDKLTDMRANVKIIIKDNQNGLALCRGMLSAEGFFDCIPPIVSSVCDQSTVTDLAFFRQRIADDIDLVGCPLDEPRLSSYVQSKPAIITGVGAGVTPTPVNVPVKSATIAVVDTDNKASTVKVDETVPIIHTNSLGDPCTQDDIRRFSTCYANISGIDFNPMTILKKPDQLEAVCEAFERFQSCHQDLDCIPPAGDGLSNMLSIFCTDDGAEYKKYSTCLQQTAQTPAGQSCADHVLPKNLLSLDPDQACSWTNEVVNCSYNELLNRCSIDTADYNFKIWQGFAKGINTSCDVETPPLSNETVIGVPIQCSPTEETAVDQCVEPFNVITDRLATLISGGLQAFLRAMRRITEIFKSGCDTRIGFDDCMRKAVTKGSQCHVSSCLIKVTEYACNFTGDSDMTLEDRLKCMWSMIGEPEFGKCLKLFPKNAFQNINRLKLYLPRFVKCLEAPLLRKCGQTTLNLVKALSSQASADPNDQTCVVYVPGLNGNGNGTVIAANTSRTTLAVVRAGIGAAVTTSKTQTTTAAPVDTRPLCTKPAEAAHLEKCHLLLNNRTYEPVPLKIFSLLSDLDPACTIYKDFANCTRSLDCRFQFTAAIQETLLRVCTVRYDDYKANANCLISLAESPRGQECTAPLYALNVTTPQTDGGQGVCQSINSMLACINQDLSDKCGAKAMDVVYDLHVAFAKQFKPDCVVKPPVLLVTGTSCTKPEMDAYENCMSKPKNYSINPISFIGEPDHFTDFCKMLNSDFQPCLKNLTCSPKPFTTAYNDTLVSVCTSDDLRTKYEKYKSCLGTVTNTPVGQQCAETYKNIQWYAGDDPNGNPSRACKAVQSALQCAAPEISQRCDQDAVKFMYDWNQRMITPIQSDCRLVIPADLPTKLNLTTTTEAPTSEKTTPPKAKEATTTPSGAFSPSNSQTIFGSILLSWLALRFLQ